MFAKATYLRHESRTLVYKSASRAARVRIDHLIIVTTQQFVYIFVHIYLYMYMYSDYATTNATSLSKCQRETIARRCCAKCTLALLLEALSEGTRLRDPLCGGKIDDTAQQPRTTHTSSEWIRNGSFDLKLTLNALVSTDRRFTGRPSRY